MHKHRNWGPWPPRFYNFCIGIGFLPWLHINPVQPLCPPDLSAFLHSCNGYTYTLLAIASYIVLLNSNDLLLTFDTRCT